jgi:hypothetical protein
MLAPEIIQAIIAEFGDQIAAQAKTDKIPVYQEFANCLKIYTDAGALKWIIAGFGMFAFWKLYLQ